MEAALVKTAILMWVLVKAWNRAYGEYEHTRDRHAGQIAGDHPDWSPRRVRRHARWRAGSYWWREITDGFPTMRQARAEHRSTAEAERAEGHLRHGQRMREVRQRLDAAHAERETRHASLYAPVTRHGLHFGSHPDDPDGVKDCLNCGRTGLVRGQPCVYCQARRRARAEWAAAGGVPASPSAGIPPSGTPGPATSAPSPGPGPATAGTAPQPPVRSGTLAGPAIRSAPGSPAAGASASSAGDAPGAPGGAPAADRHVPASGGSSGDTPAEPMASRGPFAGTAVTDLLTVRSVSGQPVNLVTGEPEDTIAVYGSNDLAARLAAAANNPDLEATVRPIGPDGFPWAVPAPPDAGTAPGGLPGDPAAGRGYPSEAESAAAQQARDRSVASFDAGYRDALRDGRAYTIIPGQGMVPATEDARGGGLPGLPDEDGRPLPGTGAAPTAASGLAGDTDCSYCGQPIKQDPWEGWIHASGLYQCADPSQPGAAPFASPEAQAPWPAPVAAAPAGLAAGGPATRTPDQYPPHHRGTGLQATPERLAGVPGASQAPAPAAAALAPQAPGRPAGGTNGSRTTGGTAMSTPAVPSGEFAGYEATVATWDQITSLSAQLDGAYEQQMAHLRGLNADAQTIGRVATAREANEVHMATAAAAAQDWSSRQGAVKEIKDATGARGDQALHDN